MVTYLVNCAGFGRFGSWKDIANDDATAMIDLDARAVVALTRACLPHMERGSRIIEVASAAAFYPLPYMNVYAASKAFVLRYTPRTTLGAARQRHHRNGTLPHLGEDRLRGASTKAKMRTP